MSILITDFDDIKAITPNNGLNIFGQDNSAYLSLYPTYNDSTFVITSKEAYELVNFVDLDNNAITFFSESRPLTEASAFIIKKCMKEKESYFELGYYYNKDNENVEIYNHAGGGRYYPYYNLLMQLYRNLYYYSNNIENDGYSKIKN